MLEQLTQELAIVGYLPPQSLSASTDTTVINIDMSKYDRLIVVILCGALGTSATVDAKLRESATSGGTYSDISGTSITQLTDAGSDSDKIVTIEVRADQLSAGKRYVECSLTVATAASQVAVLALAARAKNSPAKSGNLSSVDEQVVKA